MKLLLDLGNSRVKWAWAGPAGLTFQQARSRSELDRVLEELSDMDAPDEVLCSVVAGSAAADTVASWSGRAFGLIARFAGVEKKASGLVNAYDDPSTMGVDRWLAMIGASALSEGAFCVVDAGTAITVDRVDAQGIHQGGWILPGVALMISSLASGTANVKADGSESSRSWGVNTDECVAAGVQAAVDGTMLRLMSLLDDDNEQIYLTGGGAGALRAVLDARAVRVPDLVLQGLLRWSQ